LWFVTRHRPLLTSRTTRTSSERRRRRSVKRLVNTTTPPLRPAIRRTLFRDAIGEDPSPHLRQRRRLASFFSLPLSLSTFIYNILFFSSRFPRSETIGNYIGTIPPPPPPPPPPPHSFLLQLPIRTHRTHIFTFITYIITIMFIPVHPVSR